MALERLKQPGFAAADHIEMMLADGKMMSIYDPGNGFVDVTPENVGGLLRGFSVVANLSRHSARRFAEGSVGADLQRAAILGANVRGDSDFSDMIIRRQLAASLFRGNGMPRDPRRAFILLAQAYSVELLYETEVPKELQRRMEWARREGRLVHFIQEADGSFRALCVRSIAEIASDILYAMREDRTLSLVLMKQLLPIVGPEDEPGLGVQEILQGQGFTSEHGGALLFPDTPFARKEREELFRAFSEAEERLNKADESLQEQLATPASTVNRLLESYRPPTRVLDNIRRTEELRGHLAPVFQAETTVDSLSNRIAQLSSNFGISGTLPSINWFERAPLDLDSMLYDLTFQRLPLENILSLQDLETQLMASLPGGENYKDLADQAMATASAILIQNGVNITDYEEFASDFRGRFPAIRISPVSGRSPLNSFARRVRAQFGVEVVYAPHALGSAEAMYDPHKRRLYLPVSAIVALQPDPSTLHELEHAHLIRGEQMGRTTLWSGYISITGGAHSNTELAFNPYAEGMDLTELPAYVRDLESSVALMEQVRHPAGVAERRVLEQLRGHARNSLEQLSTLSPHTRDVADQVLQAVQNDLSMANTHVVSRDNTITKEGVQLRFEYNRSGETPAAVVTITVPSQRWGRIHIFGRNVERTVSLTFTKPGDLERMRLLMEAGSEQDILLLQNRVLISVRERLASLREGAGTLYAQNRETLELLNSLPIPMTLEAVAQFRRGADRLSALERSIR